MKKMLLVFFALCLAGSSFGVSSGVTYEFSGGRFGDNLLTYLHAKWISYKYGIPLIYKPFPYSSELVMDERERHYDQNKTSFLQELALEQNQQIFPENRSLYICPYFPEIKWELIKQSYYYVNTDWGNPLFRKVVWEMIVPKQPLQLIFPPKNTLSIAMHVREGGGFDDSEHPLKHPLKSPPLSFYITCLNKVINAFPNTPLHCQVFTDALKPFECVEKIRKGIPKEAAVSFDYRTEGNRHDENVLEDFFSLFNFDILIRPESNFSIVPALIHSYMLVYSPLSFSIEGKTVTIKEIKTESNEVIINNFLNECVK